MNVTLPSRDGETLVKPHNRVAIISPDRKISFTGLLRYASLFASHTPGKGTKTLIVSENREGWIYAIYGIWKNEGVLVPVDAASTADDIAYIINDCEPEAVWTSETKLPLVEEAIKKTGKSLKILMIDDYERADISEQEVAEIPLRLEDTACICYTSGTTGSPKGVMLSFTNIMENVKAISVEVHIFDEERRTLILLPLHHVLPLVGTAVMPLVIGGGVAICPSLSGPDIMATLKRGEVGIMIGVPRLWQTLFRGIKAKIDANPVTRKLYEMCEKAQNRTLSRTIFKSVRDKMGGHITYLVSGGAALDHETAIGLKTLGLDLLEGYGMTEASPMIAFTRPGDIVPGSVGLAIPGSEVCIINGEICARGKNVMQGYYNRPEETAAIIDQNGWLHTGDMGRIDEQGRIFITGRMKEIIVLSNGKNVNPTEIEHKLEHYADIVKEAAVAQDGDMLKAIIVPQTVWAMDKSVEEMEELIKKEVLQPYNLTVAPYKKLMSLMVYQGELPRTRMEKLQRYKLNDIIKNGNAEVKEGKPEQEEDGNTYPEYKVLKDYISKEKHCEVHPTSALETDLAMDSLDKVALQGFIEQTFGVDMSADVLAAFPNVGAIAEYLAEKKTRMEVEEIDWHKLLHKESSHLKLPKTSPLMLGFAKSFRFVAKKMFDYELVGTENIPADGPFILAPNHQSFLDAPLVVSGLSDDVIHSIYFYAKKDHIQGPLMKCLANTNNIIIMDMSTLSDSIQLLGEVLKQGKNICIFPEGTRTRDGQVGEFKKTFGILAKEINVPIIPVRIVGAYEALPRDRFLPRRHKVTVEYLPAIVPQECDTYDTLSEKTREAIMK